MNSRMIFSKVERFSQLVNYMQKRMTDSLRTIDGKTDMLETFWEHIFFKWMPIKDQYMHHQLQQINNVPKKIMRFVFMNYIR
jgi:hypothetical protein